MITKKVPLTVEVRPYTIRFHPWQNFCFINWSLVGLLHLLAAMQPSIL